MDYTNYKAVNLEDEEMAEALVRWITLHYCNTKYKNFAAICVYKFPKAKRQKDRIKEYIFAFHTDESAGSINIPKGILNETTWLKLRANGVTHRGELDGDESVTSLQNIVVCVNLYDERIDNPSTPIVGKDILGRPKIVAYRNDPAAKDSFKVKKLRERRRLDILELIKMLRKFCDSFHVLNGKTMPFPSSILFDGKKLYLIWSIKQAPKKEFVKKYNKIVRTYSQRIDCFLDVFKEYFPSLNARITKDKKYPTNINILLPYPFSQGEGQRVEIIDFGGEEYNIKELYKKITINCFSGIDVKHKTSAISSCQQMCKLVEIRVVEDFGEKEKLYHRAISHIVYATLQDHVLQKRLTLKGLVLFLCDSLFYFNEAIADFFSVHKILKIAEMEILKYLSGKNCSARNTPLIRELNITEEEMKKMQMNYSRLTYKEQKEREREEIEKYWELVAEVTYLYEGKGYIYKQIGKELGFSKEKARYLHQSPEKHVPNFKIEEKKAADKRVLELFDNDTPMDTILEVVGICKSTFFRIMSRNGRKLATFCGEVKQKNIFLFKDDFLDKSIENKALESTVTTKTDYTLSILEKATKAVKGIGDVISLNPNEFVFVEA